eukprot:5463781-Prymnesium_polylepis.1
MLIIITCSPASSRARGGGRPRRTACRTVRRAAASASPAGAVAAACHGPCGRRAPVVRKGHAQGSRARVTRKGHAQRCARVTRKGHAQGSRARVTRK